MAYQGPERRIHEVYVTKNTEYHTRRGICVGVRDRDTGEWLLSHMAMDKPLCGAIKFLQGGLRPNLGKPLPGESLYFHGGDLDLVTSTLVTVERPQKDIVARYAHA
jgi:hypothetical protein